jgi:hypothetical protein
MTTKPTPRVIGAAAEVDASNRCCTRCEKPLRGRIAWLELDQRDNTYHDRGDVPADRSQGWFPFGMDCARTILAGEPPKRG